METPSAAELADYLADASLNLAAARAELAACPDSSGPERYRLQCAEHAWHAAVVDLENAYQLMKSREDNLV